MDLQKLKYFIAIAEEKQISKAAERLHIAQPPLSRMLKQLEESLGVTLFARTTRKLELTEAGETLYKKAQIILSMVEDTKQEIVLADKGVKGILSFGIVDSIVTEFLKNYVTSFSKKYNQVRFNIIAGNTDEITLSIKNQMIEFGIVRYPFDKEEFNSIPYRQCKLVALCPKAFQMSEGTGITMVELAKFPLVIHYRYKALMEETFRKYEVSGDIKCSANDAKVIYEFVNNGLAIGILPYADEKFEDNENIVYKIIDDDNMKTAMAVIWKKDRQLSKLARAFLSEL